MEDTLEHDDIHRLAPEIEAADPDSCRRFAAGLFDHLSAVHTYGWGVSRGVASGLLGSAAFRGGAFAWTLGLLLHFFIAFAAAAIYCVASLRLRFLRDHWFVCGLFYGIAVFLVMNLIVLPLSAVPFKVGPFTVAGLRQGLLVHMLLIGLPIALSLRLFSIRENQQNR